MQAVNNANRNPASHLSGHYFLKQQIKRIVTIAGLQGTRMMSIRETKVERKKEKINK